MTLMEFIEDMPGLHRYAYYQFERIDKQALKHARLLTSGHDDQRQFLIDTLRQSAANPILTPCLRAQKTELADALERDPSGRLAAHKPLRRWAEKVDIPGTWINWYIVYVNAWIDAKKAPALVPMQATSPELEVAQ